MTTTTARSSRLWIVFAVFVAVVYLFALNIPLLGPDEPRYAQVAREMFLRGDWVTPTLGGHNWFEKPALLYWLQITFFNIFGVSEFAARLGSALFGLGTVTALWILGRRFTTEHTEISEENQKADDMAENSVPSVSSVVNRLPDFATYLLIISASSLGLLVFARGASFDIIVTFPLTAAMAGYFVHDHDHRTGKAGFPLGLVAFYFFIGLAVLAKGLIGILFPFAIVTFFHVLSRRMPSRSFVLSVFWGIPISTAIAATWYLPMYRRNGWEFIDEFIIQHHFQRFTSNKYQHPQPFHFFWWVLPLMTFPWIPFFFGGLWRSAKMFINDLKTPTPTLPNSSTPLLLYSLSWLLVPLVFFSFSGSKLPGYILPALPPAIVISAFFAWQLAAKKAIWRRLIPAIGVAMLLVVFLTLAFALPRFADRDSVRPLIAAADARGMATQRVLMFYHLSHNAEFYAAGRLLRDQTEKQRVFYKTEDLLTILAAEPEEKALVISPVEHVTALTADRRLNAEVLKDNTEHAIVAISLSTPGT